MEGYPRQLPAPVKKSAQGSQQAALSQVQKQLKGEAFFFFFPSGSVKDTVHHDQKSKNQDLVTLLHSPETKWLNAQDPGHNASIVRKQRVSLLQCHLDNTHRHGQP